MYKLLMIVFLSVLAGCSNNNSNGPTATDILENNPSADILQYEGQVFSNLTDRYQDQDMEKVELVAEVKKQTNDPSQFDDLSASTLERGTELYSTSRKGNVLLLIASTTEGDQYYRILLEG
ncbi:hypothetical protein FLK61_41410 [Paenalkalicoccus suaedae]|uniref:Uncharacterized protein n=1 Tax=Paenalkalicoccus suaedae TaxID=2592382 RepID=A0A859FJT2_9BACI|nr:hypothetical protein [Paenalkalicoccus suaedae]QKS73052.1 hypothetical protein FLK61_41410 [Paenalkalicoccus suaedae]